MDHNLQQIYWLQTKLTNLMAHYAKHFELDSLTLNGLCPTENQRMFLNCFKSLRSLTYRLICKLTPLIEGEMTEVWHALSLPRGTLECLSLQFPELEEYSSTPVYTIWSFMGELTKLTKFELIGAVELVPRLIPHLNAHQIWPPNLQHFTFAITTQSQGFTESMIDQSIIALSDHSDIWKAMPSLKTITLAPDMIEWSGRDELEDWLIPDGVELYAWSLEEQAAFPKPRPVVE
jgi:hypothetical protein